MTHPALNEQALKAACQDAGGAPEVLARMLITSYLSHLPTAELNVDVERGELGQPIEVRS